MGETGLSTGSCDQPRTNLKLCEKFRVSGHGAEALQGNGTATMSTPAVPHPPPRASSLATTSARGHGRDVCGAGPPPNTCLSPDERRAPLAEGLLSDAAAAAYPWVMNLLQRRGASTAPIRWPPPPAAADRRSSAAVSTGRKRRGA
jgi:hypothetical protein